MRKARLTQPLGVKKLDTSKVASAPDPPPTKSEWFALPAGEEIEILGGSPDGELTNIRHHKHGTLLTYTDDLHDSIA
jgi:hypothetical protein